ncbi:prepilin-type N-terminal cleavage/methylation domain-containing protein [Rickettsiales bacterium]|nr:prepilin-type N-terminal cleavage/methylation domain-containing protein [Rickettsiales bacterium]
MSINKRSSGFTLVELSIVIVIIGLIVAGVVAGQDLVKQARIKALIKDVDEYRTAYNTFRIKYEALAGDMTNATSYWASAANGDGNRLIGGFQMSETENKGFFEQLSLSGLIPGSYDGGTGEIIGVDVPPTSYSSNSSFYVNSDKLWNIYDSGNSLSICGPSDTCYDSHRVAVEDAYAIDKKIDDSMPYLGKVISYSRVSGDCLPANKRLEDLAAGDPTEIRTLEYALQDSTDFCTMNFAFDDYAFK